ncbi:MAG: fibronectin type III domain-containing protein, partial [Bacteroidales bacterium]|nr:fibronectin type III domain-containing protein [Bacteroidales bacterium]
MLLLLMMAIGAVAQVTVTIGEGTTKGHVVPVNTYFNYSLTQQIYTADEIGMAGPISSVAFYFDYTSSFSFEGIQLYMMHTTKSSFASNTDMVALDDAVLVYEGVFGATTAGWITLPLTTTFDYNGTDNLLICMYDPTYGYATSSHDFRYTSTSGSYTSIAYYSDSYTPSLDDVSSFSGTKTYNQYHNNIQLGITPSGAVCMKPTAVTVNNITAHEATVSWTAGYDETVWQICVDNDEEHLFEANSNSYNLDGLTADASHTVKVRSACEGGEFSGWTANTSFRTLVSCPAPTALTCTGVTATTATLSWTLGASETAWQICLDNDEEHLIDVDANPFTLEGLTAETAHTAKVRAVCGVDDVSAWTAVCNFEPTAKILIGSVTSTSSYLPSHSNYNYSLTQQIYTATEIGGAYNFSNIDFYNAGSTKTRNFDVYLVNTDKASFDSNSDWITVTENDKVFSGSVVMTAGVWTTITFTSDFYYDGVSNLAVIVDDNTGSYSSGMSCRVFTATGQAIYNYSDGTNYNPLSPSGSGTVSNLKNQIRLLGTPAEAPACVKPTTLTATNITARTADLTWVAGGEETAWQICLNNDEEHIIDVDAASYAFEGLTPEHTYYVKVRSVCGTSDYSEWTSNISFTTLVSCPAPTALAATLTPGNGSVATLTWTENGTATAWTLEYGTAVDFTGATSVDVSGTPSAELTGLTAETTYYARVKTVCGDDDESAWSAVCNFEPSAKIVIGTAEANNSYLPAYSLYNNSLTQQIYTAAEIGGSYNLSSIDFYNGGSDKTRNLDVYLVNTDKASFANANDWIAVTADDKVFSGEVTFTANVWTTITFTSDFYYDGVSNLAVIVDDNSGTWSSGLSCKVFETGESQSIYVYDDNINFDPTNPSDYSGTVLNVKNHIRLLGTPAEAPTCFKPTALAASNIGMETATLTWTAGASEEAWQICVNDDEENLINVTETPYTMNLTPATA